MADRINIMLPIPYEEKRFKAMPMPAIVQPKLEGDRLRSEPNGYQPLLKSSSDKLRVSIPRIAEDMRLYIPHIETDGEVYRHGMRHSQIRSIVSRTKNLHQDNWKMQYHIYDLVTDDDQETRLMMLEELFVNIRESSTLKRVPYYWVNNTEELQIRYEEFLAQGYEGIIIRHPDRPYKRTQVTWMLKLKPRLSGLYTIVGYELLVDQHGTVHADKLGSFILQDTEGKVFNVGTGFTANDRILFLYEFSRLYMDTCKIRFQAFTSATGVPKMQSVDKEWLIRTRLRLQTP